MRRTFWFFYRLDSSYKRREKTILVLEKLCPVRVAAARTRYLSERIEILVTQSSDLVLQVFQISDR